MGRGRTHTTIYILNRCPTKAVYGETPIEAWSRTKSEVSNFKIFGSMFYAHIPKEKRYKLDKKSERCIYLGYDDETKAYRLYNLETHNLMISRDVIFNEKAFSDWKNNKVQELRDDGLETNGGDS